MKTKRKLARLLVASAMAAGAIVGSATTASAEICTIDAVPAASVEAHSCEAESAHDRLLLPGFEVEDAAPDTVAGSTTYTFYARYVDPGD